MRSLIVIVLGVAIATLHATSATNSKAVSALRGDNDEYVESGRDFCWRTSYGRGVGIIPSRCPSTHPDKCGKVGLRPQCCEQCPPPPAGFFSSKRKTGLGKKDICEYAPKSGGPKKQIATKKTNALCPSHKPDEAGGLCYEACAPGFKSDGAAMCWMEPPRHLDYGWITCGMGAARNAGVCVQQVSDAVMGVVETALFVVSLGTSSVGSTPAKAGYKSLSSVTSAKKAAKMFKSKVQSTSKVQKVLKKAKYYSKFRDPVFAGKKLQKALGWAGKVDEVGDLATATKKGIKAINAASAAQDAQKATKATGKFAKGTKTIYDAFGKTLDVKATVGRVYKSSNGIDDWVKQANKIRKHVGNMKSGLSQIIKVDDESSRLMKAIPSEDITDDELEEYMRKAESPEKCRITDDEAEAAAMVLCLVTDSIDEASALVESFDEPRIASAWADYVQTCAANAEAVDDEYESMLLSLSEQEKKRDHCAELEALNLENEVSDPELAEIVSNMELTAEGQKYVGKMKKQWDKIKNWVDTDEYTWAVERFREALEVMKKNGALDDEVLENAKHDTESQVMLADPTAALRTTIGLASILDPTGIASNIAAYLYPNCCEYFLDSAEACKRVKNYDKKVEKREARREKKQERLKLKAEQKACKQAKRAAKKDAREKKRIERLRRKNPEKLKRVQARKLKKADKQAAKAMTKLGKDIRKGKKKEKRHLKKIENKEKRLEKKEKNAKKREEKKGIRKQKKQSRKNRRTVKKNERLDKKHDKKVVKFNEKKARKKAKKVVKLNKKIAKKQANRKKAKKVVKLNKKIAKKQANRKKAKKVVKLNEKIAKKQANRKNALKGAMKTLKKQASKQLGKKRSATQSSKNTKKALKDAMNMVKQRKERTKSKPFESGETVRGVFEGKEENGEIDLVLKPNAPPNKGSNKVPRFFLRGRNN